MTDTMDAAARSIFVYSLNLGACGFALLIYPHFFLKIVGVMSTDLLWPRLFGLLAVEIAFYLMVIAKKGLSEFYGPTIFGRLFASAAFCALVSLGVASWQLLVVAAIDALSSAWTYRSIKRGAKG